MTQAILVLNLGSSSLKFALYEAGRLDVLCRGGIGGIGGDLRFDVSGPRAGTLRDAGELPGTATHGTVIRWLIEALRIRMGDVEITAAGHRVVHGGRLYHSAVRIDEDVLVALDQLISLAPGHEPHNIAGIKAVAECWPGLEQVACFDTQFHRTQPRLAQMFALPHALTDEGMLRYGFHGLSYSYIASVLPEYAGLRAEGRVVAAHLGNGASMCAMLERRSVATTMGFSALDGLMMGTRPGSLDAGVVLHLIQQKGMSAEEVCELLYCKSGLLGVSGVSSDVRDLEASSDPRAGEALDLFTYRAVRELGSLYAVLGGLDVLVFTGGIGEHQPRMRERICSGAAWAGIVLDSAANTRGDLRISAPSSSVDVLVVPADEEIVIARATRDIILGLDPGSHSRTE